MHGLFSSDRPFSAIEKFYWIYISFIIYQLQTKNRSFTPVHCLLLLDLSSCRFIPAAKNRQQRRQLIKRQQKCENRKNKPDKSQNNTCNKVKQSKHPESCAVGSAAEVCIIAERIDIVMYTSHILCFFTPALITCTTAENNASEKYQCKFLPAKGSFF